MKNIVSPANTEIVKWKTFSSVSQYTELAKWKPLLQLPIHRNNGMKNVVSVANTLK